MAEEHTEQVASVHGEEGEGEVKDRGLFDFIGKKETEEKKHAEEDYLVTGVQNIHIEEGYKPHHGKDKEEEKHHDFLEKEEEKKEEEKKEEEKHHGLLDKLHRSHSSSSSSSSSDEEEEVEGEGGIKEKIKKKKKALKEKIEEKEHHEEENKKPAFVPVEEPVVVVEELELHEPAAAEEGKKGFLEKLKDKLPGHSKKPTEEGAAAPPVDVVEGAGEHGKVHEAAEGTEGKEKKGFLGKIIEKLPGYHKSTGEEGDKAPGSH